MRGQEPVSRERAGHIESSCCTVWKSPCKSHSKGPWDDCVPGEAGVQGVDYWRSPGPEVPINHKAKKFNLCQAPNIYTNSKSICQHGHRWPFCGYIEKLKIISKPTHCEGDKSPTCPSHVWPTWDLF